MTRVRDYWGFLEQQSPTGVLSPALDTLRRQMADWTEVIEVGVSDISRLEIDRMYDESFNAPNTDFDFFNQGREQAFLGGLQGQEAAQFGNFFLGEERGNEPGELSNFSGFNIAELLAGL